MRNYTIPSHTVAVTGPVYTQLYSCRPDTGVRCFSTIVYHLLVGRAGCAQIQSYSCS